MLEKQKNQVMKGLGKIKLLSLQTKELYKQRPKDISKLLTELHLMPPPKEYATKQPPRFRFRSQSP
jgi:hypothetical protein